MPSILFRVCLTMALCGALMSPVALAATSQNETTEHMRQGMTLIQDGKAAEALEEFEKAIELSPELGSAHYYAGMALGQLQRFEESLEQFIAAGELDPGNGQAHVMACRTAYALQNYEEAWNQGILAAQTGVDMSQAFAGLEEVSERPADFDARMSVPRVFVAEVDLSRATLEDSSPDSTTGATTTIGLRMEDYIETRRQLGLSLDRSERFAVTQSPEQANYVLLVEIDDAAANSGLAKLIDPQTDEVAAMRPITLPSSVGGIRSVTDRLVGFFEEWLENR